MSDYTTKPSIKNPDIFLATFCGSGYVPFAPGTAGSAATAILLALLGRFNPPFFLYIPFLLPLSFASWFVIRSVEMKYQVHDPKWIVIDEVVGMWLTILFLPNHNYSSYLLAFIYFRLFDILKPWPVSYFDALNTPFGTLFDDVVAGTLAGISCILTFKLLELLS